MKPITKTINVNPEDYLITHLRIVNSVLPIRLSEKQLCVLSAFMEFKGELSDDIFGTTSRKIIKKKLNLSDANLSNYIKSFIESGFVKNTGGRYEVRDVLKANEDNQVYQFKVQCQS